MADSWFLLQGGSVRAATVVDGLLDSYTSHMNSGPVPLGARRNLGDDPQPRD